MQKSEQNKFAVFQRKLYLCALTQTNNKTTHVIHSGGKQNYKLT